MRSSITLSHRRMMELNALSLELRAISSIERRRLYAVTEISRLLRARIGVCSLIDRRTSEQLPCYHALVGVGLELSEYRMLGEYLSGAKGTDPTLLAIIRLGNRRLVRCRSQLVDDEHWYQSRFYQEVKKQLDLDDGVYSWEPSPHCQGIRALCFHRTSGKPPFVRRDKAILRLAFRLCADLLFPAAVDSEKDALASLPPPLSETAIQLLTEKSEKQIAVSLGISKHTLHHRVKQVYRTLQLSSRIELLVRHGRIERHTLRNPPSHPQHWCYPPPTGKVLQPMSPD